MAVQMGQAGDSEGPDAVVQFGMVVWAKAQDVPDDVRAVVWNAEGLNVMRGGVRDRLREPWFIQPARHHKHEAG